MTDRIPLDDLTSDQLDQLYADLDRYEEAVGELNEANIDLQRQAARAEQEIDRMKLLVVASSEDGHTVRRTAQKLAALERVRALAAEWGEPAHCSWLSASVLVGQLRAALDQAQQPTTAEPPSHLPDGGNAEDCDACRPEIDKTVLYPWICPGPNTQQQPTT